MKKFLAVIGTRPQLIKYRGVVPTILVDTGQHYDKELLARKIPKPKYSLKQKTLGGMIDKLIPILEKEKPHYVIVYGDTRSTLAGAIAAQQLNIPIVHIEAGARSFNNNMIEERIRVLVDEISSVHLCASAKHVDNLQNNRIIKLPDVFNCGATQIDTIWETFPTKRPKDAFKYFVATIHRQENVNDISKLKNILKAFNDSECNIEFYCHPNTLKIIKKNKIKLNKNVKLLKPIDRKKMINRMAFARAIVTDSGGMQVEAYFIRRPCITLRDETEWVETVEDEHNVLVGSDYKKIKDSLVNCNPVLSKHNTMAYGMGKSYDYIKNVLKNL